MAEYIKREALLDSICHETCGIAFCGATNCAFMAKVCSAPVADVAPVVHGCFEPCFDENGNWRQGFAKCSNCGKEYYAQVINHFGYCPNCGAKMDGGADNA